MAENNIWDIIFRAAVDLQGVDKDIDSYIHKLEQSSSKQLKLRAKLETTTGADARQEIERELNKEKQLYAENKKQIANLVQKHNIDLQKYTQQNVEAQRKADEQIVKNSKAANQQLLKDAQNTYAQLNKLKKDYASNKDNMSASDKNLYEKAIAQTTGKLGGITRQVNKSGDTEAIATLNIMKQEHALQTAMDNAKIRASEQARANRQQELADAQRIKQAYQEALAITREIGQNEKKVAQLSGTPDAKDKNKNLITELNQQTAELQRQKEVKMQIVNLDSELASKVDTVTKKYERQTEQIKANNQDLQDTAKQVSTIGDYMKRVANYVLLYQALNMIQQGVRDTIELVKELDAAFTDIQMVQNMTKEQVGSLMVEYNQLAKELSSTTAEVAAGATEWLRQGKSMEETTQLLKSSMVLSKVGAIEASEATELLTSSLNGYKKEASEAMSIVDKVSLVDMEAATSSEELMVALSRTASSADLAGVSFDKLIGMIATVSQTTRKSASTIGESFKTLFARLQNVAAGKTVDDMGESLNDVEKSLNSVGIKLRTSAGEWRNMEDVIDEVAESWKTLNGVEQAQLATAIAGTRQRENFIVLMENYDEVMRLTEVSMNSAGSAMEKFGIWEDSIEAKTNQLKATWEEFVISLGQSDSYKALLDIGIWAIQNLPLIIGFVTSLTVLLKGAKIADIIKKVAKGFGKMTNPIASLGKNLQILRFGWTRNAEGMLQVATAAETSAAALSMLQLAISATIAVIAIGVQAYNSWKQAQYEAGQNAREEADSYGQTADALEKLKDEYTEVANSIMNADEKKSQLVTLQSQLNDAYGKEKSQIDLVNQSYERNIELLQEKIDKEKSLELSKLKVSAEAGESNLDNWTNLYNDVEVSGKIAKQDNEKVINALQKIGQDKIGFYTGGYRHSEIGPGGKIYNTGDQAKENVDKEILGLMARNYATNEESLKYAQEIEGFVEDNIDTLSQETKDTLIAFASKLKSEVDKDAPDQFSNKQKYQMALFENNNQDAINNYNNNLKKQKELQEKYTNETNAEQKESYKRQLAEQEKLTQESLDKIKSLYNYQDANQSTLSENYIEKYLGAPEESANNLYTKLDEAGGQQLYDLMTQLTKSGELTDELKNKIAEMRKVIAGLGDEDALKDFDAQLKGMGIQINSNAEKWKDFKNALNARTTEYQFNEQNELVGTKEMSDYEKFLQVEQDLQNLLSADGIKFSDSWYNSLKEQLKKGEISGQQFFDKLSDGAKAFGVDIDNLISKTSKLGEINPVLGTQNQFVEEMDSVDQLYSDAASIKGGGTLGNDRIVELRNEYAELNKYIAETGDLTFKNGAMLSEIANNTYEDGQSALEGQITALENYQDAILNTVDAMGIMAEFQEELAKLDKDLAATITDDAIAQAEAKGMYTDIAATSADGVYTANEMVADSEGLLLDSTQAAAMGIIDSKDAENEIASQAAEATIAANDIIQASDSATADQKIASAEFVGNAKTTEAEITAGAAETEAVAEGSSAEASAQGAQSKANSQSIAASAAIATGQAFIEMARAIAQAEGIETGALDSAGQKLSELQGKLDTLDAQNASDAQKAAQAYKEAQAKIQESKARLNSLKSANKTGQRNYANAGKKSGGSGSKKSDEEKLAENIQKFREEEGTELEDVTEELINQYKAEARKLKLAEKNLDYAEGLVDAEENTTKWLEIQNQKLTNQRKQVQAIYRENSKIEQQLSKIQSENSGYDINSWFDEDGNATLAYANLLNSFAEQEKQYRATVAINSEEDLENAKKHIEQIKKQREYVENLFDSTSKLKDAWIQNRDELQNYITEMNDTLKQMRDQLLGKLQTALERQVEETNKIYENNISKLESLITVQERYNDVINSALDTQAELRKELQSNKDSYQYLDDYMRSIIFNEEDYKQLSGALDDLMTQMDTLSSDYQERINSLTEDEMYKIEEITAEYERQVEIKQKEYELLKAQLDVVKARTKLENAQNERTVRMFVNGAWQWVADPNAIKSASQELADAEAEQDRIEREKAQQEYINDLEAQKDNNQLEIDLNNQLLEKIQTQIDDIINETKSVEEWLKLIAEQGPPMLHDVISGASDKLVDLLENLGLNSSLVGDASKNTTDAIRQGLLNGTLNPDEWGEKLGWIKGDNGKWYMPESDPLYDPSGFDFGKVNPETQTGTADNGVQTQTTGSGTTATNTNSQSSQKFPRQGSLRNVSSVLNIRSGAGMAYGVVGKIPPSGKPQILGEQGEWAQVKFNGITGWANRNYLTYDKGGLMRGKGIALKDVITPEAVLSPEQTKSWVKLVDNLTNPMLAHLTRTPTPSSNKKDKSEQFIGDTYTFNNVTVKANDIQEFIASMKGQVPIRNK